MTLFEPQDERDDKKAGVTVSGSAALPVNERILGCFLGSALGDALGAPVEDLKLSHIKARFGEGGVTHLAPAFGRRGGAITDVTQLLLFTAEGIVRTATRFARGKMPNERGMIWMAYRRWAHTQGHLLRSENQGNPDGWLLQQGFLYNLRNPGPASLAALRGNEMPLEGIAVNDSKGNGSVARSAPFGLFAAMRVPEHAPTAAFELARDAASLTHGHRVAQDAAGAYAALIASLARGQPLLEAVSDVRAVLHEHRGADEVVAHFVAAQARAASNASTPVDDLPEKWRGYVAEEALAIGLYAALTAPDFVSGVRIAVNHSGDSDVTGAICGGLLGTRWGADVLPEEWLDQLEGRESITRVAADVGRILTPKYRVTEEDDWRYPGL